MPVQSTPKEVDPGDVALSPDKDICEDIYQRVLGEVRARIDQRIADIEAQAAASEPIEASDVVADDGEHSDVQPTRKRRPRLRTAISLTATAGLVWAGVTLARDHVDAMTSVTERIDAALRSVRESLPSVRESVSKIVSTDRSETAISGSSPAESVPAAPASPPSVPPALDATPARSSDPSSAMAEAPPEHESSSTGERDLAPLIEKIAHDVAELQAGLKDLKAGQEQANRDHVKAIEQLQASPEQLTRAVRASKTEAAVGPTARLAPRPPPPRDPHFR